MTSTFPELLDIAPRELRPLMNGMRDLVLSLHPETTEIIRLGDRAASYGYGPKKMSDAYVYILPYANWVNLGFYHGANLAGPKRLLVGTGKNMRHVRLNHADDLLNVDLQTLVKEAIFERATTLNLP